MSKNKCLLHPNEDATETVTVQFNGIKYIVYLCDECKWEKEIYLQHRKEIRAKMKIKVDLMELYLIGQLTLPLEENNAVTTSANSYI